MVKKLEKTRQKLRTGRKWIAGLSSIAIVTGVILCFTGFGAPIGAGLIASGAAGLACAFTENPFILL